MPRDKINLRAWQIEYLKRPEVQERNREKSRKRRLLPGVAKAQAEHKKIWIKRPGNRDRQNKWSNDYYYRNKDRLNAEAKIKREENPIPHKLSVKKWASNNKHKRLESFHRRQAILKDSPNENCSEKIKVLRTARFCHWCCCKIQYGVNLHIDHVVPVNRGGGHINDNLVASCETCNTSRGCKLVHEWAWPDKG